MPLTGADAALAKTGAPGGKRGGGTENCQKRGMLSYQTSWRDRPLRSPSPVLHYSTDGRAAGPVTPL